MKQILLLIIGLGLLSCNKTRTTPEDDLKAIAIKRDFPVATKLLDSVITTPAGNYYKLVPEGLEEFRIEWGRSSTKKISRDKYHLMAAQTIGFSWESDQFIVLHNEYTKLGRYDYFLPLQMDSSEYVVENALLYDTARNLVAWEPPFKETPIIIENYFTRNTQAVTENHGCGAILIEFCLDSIAFDKDILYYKLGLPRLDDPEGKFIERRIQIKI